MATHSGVLAWRIPGTEEPGGLPSIGSHRVGLDWSDLAAVAATVEKEMAAHSSVLAWRIPGTEELGRLQSQSQRVRHDWSNLACMHMHEYLICSTHTMLSRLSKSSHPSHLFQTLLPPILVGYQLTACSYTSAVWPSVRCYQLFVSLPSPIHMLKP